MQTQKCGSGWLLYLAIMAVSAESYIFSKNFSFSPLGFSIIADFRTALHINKVCLTL